MEQKNSIHFRYLLLLRARNASGRMPDSCLDNGKGIPPDKKDWIFLPLKTTSDIGSGLGLFMIKRTLEKMNGYIAVDPNAEGATFEIVIPYFQGGEQ